MTNPAIEVQFGKAIGQSASRGSLRGQPDRLITTHFTPPSLYFAISYHLTPPFYHRITLLELRPGCLAGRHGRTRQPKFGDGVLLEKFREFLTFCVLPPSLLYFSNALLFPDAFLFFL